MRKCVLLHYTVVASESAHNTALLRGRLNSMHLECELLPEAIPVRLSFAYRPEGLK